MAAQKEKTLILIDSSALIHRAYHALPPLATKKGELVNAVYGFASVLLKILRELKPDYVLAAFDLPAPTFRHLEYKEYKAHRPKTPEDLSAQFGRVKEVLAAFNIQFLEKAGYEADDIIGTVVQKTKSEKQKLNTVIVTGDLDTLQLVGGNVFVHTLKKGVSETAVYGEKEILERFGLKPEQLADFKGLKGDPSDNIPGVKGVGEKTASDLLKKFGSLENLYEALEKKKADIPEKTAEKLEAGKEAAFFSKKLATIDRNVPVDFSLEKCAVSEFDREKTAKLFQELEFFTLLKRLPRNGEEPADAEESEEKRRKEPAAKLIEIKNDEDLKKLKTLFAESGKTKTLALAAELSGGPLFPEQKLILAASPDAVYSVPAALAAADADLKKVFRDAGIKKIGHNLKPVLKILNSLGIGLNGLFFDAMLAAYLLNPGERDYSFAKIVFREFGREPAGDFSDFGGIFELEKSLSEKIKREGLEKVFFEIETPLIPVLAEMEKNGFKINISDFKKMSEEIGTEIAKLEKKIYKAAGAEFNVNSPKQLSEILFQKLKIGTKGLRKTAAGGAVSTQASELEKLKEAHPIIPLILEYRELAKLKTTYVDALPALAEADGKIRTTFEQTITATGRLSSRDPNLQNIPAQGKWAIKIRSAFLAREGFELAAFDYSQIELRIAAALSGDEKMAKAFLEGKDIHALTAAEINNVPEEKITPEMRRQAKTLNFGVLYGMAAKSFAESSGLPLKEAQNFINEYFRDFSGLAEFLEKTKEEARKTGYVSTLTGRRRFLPEINSQNWQLRQAAERMAINMPIQGLAADIVKMAMVEIARKEILGADCRLLLQAHDELIFEIKEKKLKETAEEIKKTMEDVFSLPAKNGKKIPLSVNVCFGKNWGEC